MSRFDDANGRIGYVTSTAGLENTAIDAIMCRNTWTIFTWMWLRYAWVFAIANPSVVCYSIMFVHVTQVENFRNISSPFCTLTHLLTSVENFTEIVPGNPFVGALDARG